MFFVFPVGGSKVRSVGGWRQVFTDLRTETFCLGVGLPTGPFTSPRRPTYGQRRVPHGATTKTVRFPYQTTRGHLPVVSAEQTNGQRVSTGNALTQAGCRRSRFATGTPLFHTDIGTTVGANIQQVTLGLLPVSVATVFLVGATRG